MRLNPQGIHESNNPQIPKVFSCEGITHREGLRPWRPHGLMLGHQGLLGLWGQGFGLALGLWLAYGLARPELAELCNYGL
jgi:hypothetical protein